MLNISISCELNASSLGRAQKSRWKRKKRVIEQGEKERQRKRRFSVGLEDASPRSRWPIWSHTVTFFVLPRSRKTLVARGSGARNGARDKVSKLGTYRRDRAVDFRAVGSFEETIWTTGEAIAAWSRAWSGRERSDGHGMPMERRREGSTSRGSTDRGPATTFQITWRWKIAERGCEMVASRDAEVHL